MRKIFTFCILSLFLACAYAVTDSSYLYGIHWYGNTDSISPEQRTDVEDMSGDKGIWDLEITHVDAARATAWDLPSYYSGHSLKVTQGKGHSLIFRVQPYWGRNVPHSSDLDYTLANYSDDCKAAANTLKDYCHIWQIGNEVNLWGENKHWNGSSDYTVEWDPSPSQYADTYVACRDKIHEITPTTMPATQIVLMQPNSPGNVIPLVRFMDGNEFLWGMIEAVSDKDKIDGFAIHGYAEPGGTNYGLDGYWDSIREQLMIIDELGLGDRPVFITEWNKHMPDLANAEIGAKFLHRAYTLMNSWNTGSDGEWPGLSNHNVLAATWFVYPSGYGWDDYSLKSWKNNTSVFDEERDPWKSFNYSCGYGYAKGATGGGPTVPQDSFWWQDTFDGSSLDQGAPLPDWKAGTTGGGSVVMSGTGSVRFLGNGAPEGGGGIQTAGYVYGNFHMEANITFTNAAPSNASPGEANFDIRLREGSKGYSVTFYTSQSPSNPGRIILRRANDWTQIGSYNVAVTGGINSGDNFDIKATANGSNIQIKIYKNSGTTPVVDWNITDSGQKVGWIRLMSYNLNEARVNDFRIGGHSWSPPSEVETWELY
jgi:predicted outer membrane repeat protein